MFSIEVMTNAAHIPAAERMDEAARRWKEMSDEKKNQYTAKVKQVGWILKIQIFKKFNLPAVFFSFLI